MNQIVTFDKNEEGVKLFSIFISQLVKEGVIFEIINGQPLYQIKILNGF